MPIINVHVKPELESYEIQVEVRRVYTLEAASEQDAKKQAIEQSRAHWSEETSWSDAMAYPNDFAEVIS